MNSNYNIRYFLWSIAGHGLILSGIGYVYVTQFGIKQATLPSLPTYFAHSARQPISKRKQGIEKQQVNHETSMQYHAVSTQKSVSLPGETDQKILTLLHKAIAEKQYYPEGALSLGQSGSVTVGFIVSSNGVLSAIKLMKSSGYSLLDYAALDAVQSVGAVSDVASYLKSPQFFSIDVIYSSSDKPEALSLTN